MSERLERAYIYDVCPAKSNVTPHYYFSPDFETVMEEAQFLLKEFSEEDLVKATYLLDRVTAGVGVESTPPEYWLKEHDTYGDYSAGRHTAYVRRLLRNNQSPSEELDLANLTWPKCFALISLSIVAYACRDEKYMLENNFSDEDIAWRLGRYAIEATRFISYAESREGDLAILGQFDRSHRVIGAKGGKARVSIYDELKNKCLGFYSERFSHLSNRAAAKKIYALLTPEDLSGKDGRNLLIGDQPENTIERWIGRYKRESTSLD